MNIVVDGDLRARLLPDGTYELLGAERDHATALQRVVEAETALTRKLAGLAELRNRMQQRLRTIAAGMQYGPTKPSVRLEAVEPVIEYTAEPTAVSDVLRRNAGKALK
jgi:hypothetical protein